MIKTKVMSNYVFFWDPQSRIPILGTRNRDFKFLARGPGDFCWIFRKSPVFFADLRDLGFFSSLGILTPGIPGIFILGIRDFLPLGYPEDLSSLGSGFFSLDGISRQKANYDLRHLNVTKFRSRDLNVPLEKISHWKYSVSNFIFQVCIISLAL